MVQTIRVTASGNPIIGANGGGGPSYVPTAAAASLSVTYTAENETGAAVDAGNYWRFQHFFKKGDVPSGNKIVAKVGGTELTQVGFTGRKTWGDGSLKFAKCTYKLDSTISSSASQSVVLTAESGSFDDTNSIGTTAFTNLDLSISWDESGGSTYTSSFNDLVATATTLESCPTHKTLWAQERTHLSGGTDHARAVASWYVSKFTDGSAYRVWCELISGYANETKGAANAVKVGGSVVLKSGSTTLMSHTTASVWLFPSSKAPMVDADGLEYWHGGHPDLTHKHDLDYMITSGLMWRFCQSYATSLPTLSSSNLQFYDNDKAIWNASDRDTGGPGGNPWVGPICGWDSIALIANAPGGTAAKRAAAQKYSRKKMCAYLSSNGFRMESNGYVPNLISDIATFSPLTARGNDSYYNGWTHDNWDDQDMDHAPQPFYGRWAMDGDPWLRDNLVQKASNLIGWLPPTTSGQARERTLDGQLMFCYEDNIQTRSPAWLFRDCVMASLVTPDGHTEKSYFDRVINDYTTALDKRHKNTAANGGRENGSDGVGVIMPMHWAQANQMSHFGHFYLTYGMYLNVAAEVATDAQVCFESHVVPFVYGLAELDRSYLGMYRTTTIKSDRYVLDGTLEHYSSWSEIWGGTGNYAYLGFTGVSAYGQGRGWDVAEAVITGKTGTFTQGETVTGGTSGHSGRVIDDASTTRLRFLGKDIGQFTLGETLTGSSSGAVATLSSRSYGSARPLVVNTTYQPGQTAPNSGSYAVTGTYASTNRQVDICVLGSMAACADLMQSATAVANAKAHWDNIVAEIEGAYTDTQLMQLPNTSSSEFMLTYRGSGK